uniref:Cytoskeleton-associated protein 5 n=1 Tax=Cacopsylla melanoneura TaxID=428564 RepID=A0A8D8W5H1_9HEMI
MEEDTEYIKLPVEERCVHKVWKARVHGYEEATKLFRQTSDEKSPEFNKFLGLIKKFVIDSNAVAQEKGLEATLAYVENAAVASRTVGEVISGIVNKCIAAPKTKTKDLSLQIILMYIEIEKQDIVMEELIKGLDHKTPKNVAACVNAITSALREFGEKVIGLKPLLKKCPSILEHKDNTVREEGKALMVEIFRWIGAALRPQLSNLKPVQVTELEAEFEKMKGARATPQRYLRSQQAKQAEEEAVEDRDDADGVTMDSKHMKSSAAIPRVRGRKRTRSLDGGDGSGDEAGPDVDPLDLMDPVDILSKLPKNFYDKLEEKKWQERKEAMDGLEKLLTESPKLETGDYGDLVRALKKLITKDSNVVVVGVGCKCLAMLVNGLKKKFHPYAGATLPACLEKFKEKKQNVVTPLRDAVDAIYVCTTLEAILEDVLAALENKNPQVKGETVAFLGRCFTKCTPLILNKKLLKTYVTALLKTLNEPDPTVRENSMVAIGTAMKVVGEKAIMPFLEDVNDANKMTKIKEYCDKAVLCVKQPKPQKERPTTAPSKAPAAKGGSNAPKVVKTGGAAKAIKGGGGAVNSATMTRKPAASGGGAKPKPSSGASKSSSSSKLGPSGGRVSSEKDLNDEEVEERAGELLPSNMVADLTDANWKTRLAAMEQLKPIITDIEDAPGTAQVLIRILNKKPGFKDNNFQVLKLRLESVKVICEKCKITSTTVGYCLTDIASYLGDAKNGALASEVLTSLAEATRLDYVSAEVLNYAFTTQKSPKVQQEALTWLSKAILEFGFVVEPKSLMENVKKAVAASNPQVRTACISLLGTLYLYMGKQLSFFFENEKPALVQQINAEFEKNEGKSPPAPTRGVGGGGGGKSEEGAEEGDEEEAGGQQADFNIQDVLPRVDISGQITEQILTELSDKNWKVKGEALTKLQAMIGEARFITPNLGELPSVLAARLTDSNSKIAQQAVALVEQIGGAMGNGCKKYVRVFFPGLLQGMGDSKTWIRSAAVTCINKWGEACGFKEFFDGEMIYDALKAGSPILRQEVWAWLAITLPEVKTVPKEELHACLLLLYSNLEDRNADVRKNAADAAAGFMIHLGYGPMSSACEKLKPASATTVKTLLDKTRGTVPDRSGTAEKPKAKAAAAPGKQVSNKSGSGGSGTARTVNSATMSRSKSKTNLASAKAPIKSSKKDEDVDLSPLLQVNSMKHQRVIDESKLKILKWNFTTPREEFVELLRDQMTSSNVNKTLIANMFHADFKYHLKAIDSLNEDLQHNVEALTCNLDLILKWMTLRFFDTNPSVLLKGLEYMTHVLEILIEQNYRVSEQEASSFIPYLILKIGDPKDTVRASVRSLFRQLGSVYPLAKLFGYVMDGLKSKNARQRTECLEVLAWSIETYGMSVCAAGSLKEIAKQIGDRDNSVRTAALNCIVQAHFLDGDKVFRQIGQISEKDMSLLEERIKRASKTRRPAPPVATVKPTPSRLAPPPQPQPDEEDEDEEEDRSYHDEDEGEEEEAVGINPRGLPVAPTLLRKSPTPDIQNKSQVPDSEHTLDRTRDSDLDSSIDPLGRLRAPQPRPISGPYSLDMHLIESLETETPASSVGNRVRLNEFDLTYLKEPVPLPSSVLPNGNSGAGGARTLNSSSSILNNSSGYPGNNINVYNTIEQISSKDSDVALKAMQSVEHLILTEKWSQLVPHADWLVRNMVDQLATLRQSEQLDLVNCYRAVFSLCMKLYNVPPLCEKVNEDALHHILKELLMLLSEKKSAKWETTLNMFLKVMNSLALRILERSDHTAAVCATFRVLFDGIKLSIDRPSKQVVHFIELAWKCMWKLIKFFPEWDSSLDYVRILAEAHTFLQTFPSSWWRNQPINTPLRTVKTVIHSMARNRHSDLVQYLNQVPGVTEDCELYYYVHKMQQQFKSDEPSSRPSGQTMSLSRPNESMESNGDMGGNASANMRVTKANADALTEIFKKIGNKDDTHEGLRLLYKWKQEHPEQPLDLTQYSQVFQDYIKRGLKNIELEIRCEQSNKENKRGNDRTSVPSSPASAVSNQSSEPEDAGSTTASYYSKRLKDLQMMAGLVQDGAGSGGGGVTTPRKPKIETEISDLEQLQNISPQRYIKVTSPENFSSVESLRMRLEKIKQPSNS